MMPDCPGYQLKGTYNFRNEQPIVKTVTNPEPNYHSKADSKGSSGIYVSLVGKAWKTQRLK